MVASNTYNIVKQLYYNYSSFFRSHYNSCALIINFMHMQSSDKQLESIIFEMTKEDSVAFGKVFGAILEKRYPQLMEDNSHDWITLGVLLEWIVWPTYLKIVKQGSILLSLCCTINLSPPCS